MTQPIYKIDDMNFKSKSLEGTREEVGKQCTDFMKDIAHLANDPTTEAMVLTAIARGSDQTITVKEVTLQNHIGEDSHTSQTAAYTYSWKHRVPESVREVFDNLSGNLSVYATDNPEDDPCCSIAVGDPSNETFFTNAKEDLNQSFFTNVEDETDNDDVSDDSED